MRSFYVVRSDDQILDMGEFLSVEDFLRLADNDGFIAWDHKGSYFIIPTFQLKNAASLIRSRNRGFMEFNDTDAIRWFMKFNSTNAIRLDPLLAEAITGR